MRGYGKYSEKAKKLWENLLLSYVVSVKSKGEISQNFVAFSEYMNFKKIYKLSKNNTFFSRFERTGWEKTNILHLEAGSLNNSY